MRRRFHLFSSRLRRQPSELDNVEPNLPGMERVSLEKDPSIEACVLAGGLSTRMGQDKSALRLRGRSLLAWAKTPAMALGLRPRVIRIDLVDRCGPIGGVYTALRTTSCSWVLFLSCDMPFLGIRIVEQLMSASRRRECAFFEMNSYVGFPFVLSRGMLEVTDAMIAAGRYSMQELAVRSGALKFQVPEGDHWRMSNINTPEMLEWAKLRSVENSDLLGA